MWDWSGSKNRGPGRARPVKRRKLPMSHGDSEYFHVENKSAFDNKQKYYSDNESRQSFTEKTHHDEYTENEEYGYPIDDETASWQSQEDVPAYDASMWKTQFEQMNLFGMTLKEFNFVFLDPDSRNELRSAFKRARRDFLKFIAYYHAGELKAGGVSDAGIKRMKRGRSPENYNVHIKVPVDYSGSNDFSNLVLMPTHPYHNELHKFLDMQVAQHPINSRLKRLYIPVPAGKIYIPSEEGGVLSSGGVNMDDKSVAAGFNEKNIAELAMKRRMSYGVE